MDFNWIREKCRSKREKREVKFKLFGGKIKRNDWSTAQANLGGKYSKKIFGGKNLKKIYNFGREN